MRRTAALIGKLRIPELVSNLTWGGPDWRTLYITATHSVYAVPVKVGPRNEPYMRGSQKAGRGPAGTGSGAAGHAIGPQPSSPSRATRSIPRAAR